LVSKFSPGLGLEGCGLDYIIVQHRPVYLKTFGKAAKCRLWRFSKFRGVE